MTRKEELTIEELKTAIGCIMGDLRGNWAFEYNDRMIEVKELLEALIEKEPKNKDYKEDLKITESEINEPYDGRIFRDECNLFGYSSELGKTKRVKEYIDNVVTYPEYYSFELK